MKISKTWEDLIKESGCIVVGVFDAEPPFGYSVGLTDKNWPELIFFGDEVVAGCIINRIVAMDEPPEAGKVIEGFFADKYDLRFDKMSIGAINWYMPQGIYRQMRVGGPAPSGLQLVVQDRQHRWPEDPNYDIAAYQKLDEFVSPEKVQ